MRSYANTTKNVILIFRALKKAHTEGKEFVTIGDLSRATKLHKWTVSRTLDLWMQGVVDIVSPEELEGVGMRLKLVRLGNPSITEQQVLRMLKIKF